MISHIVKVKKNLTVKYFALQCKFAENAQRTPFYKPIVLFYKPFGHAL